MKIAVMQPYLFPYLGYYQMVHCVDAFVLYDDVTFIKGGWINRNNILFNDEAKRLTIPVPGASSNKKIKSLRFSEDVSKVLKTIHQAYVKAPFFARVFPIVERVLTYPERDIATVCDRGLAEVFQYLNIDKHIIRSRDLDYDRDLPAADRLVGICEKLGSKDYVNSIGGRKLYSKEYFREQGCSLSFIQMNEIEYPQAGNEFVSHLSMIDVLMWCDKQQVVSLLEQYTLL